MYTCVPLNGIQALHQRRPQRLPCACWCRKVCNKTLRPEHASREGLTERRLQRCSHTCSQGAFEAHATSTSAHACLPSSAVYCGEGVLAVMFRAPLLAAARQVCPRATLQPLPNTCTALVCTLAPCPHRAVRRTSCRGRTTCRSATCPSVASVMLVCVAVSSMRCTTRRQIAVPEQAWT